MWSPESVNLEETAPSASCFWNNRARRFVLALNYYSSLPGNANLLQCPACPSGLPLPVSPFHAWQSISPRPPSAAACPQQHNGPDSGCLVRNVYCCSFPNMRQQGGSNIKSRSMFQICLQNFISLFDSMHFFAGMHLI